MNQIDTISDATLRQMHKEEATEGTAMEKVLRNTGGLRKCSDVFQETNIF